MMTNFFSIFQSAFFQGLIPSFQVYYAQETYDSWHNDAEKSEFKLTKPSLITLEGHFSYLSLFVNQKGKGVHELTNSHSSHPYDTHRICLSLHTP